MSLKTKTIRSADELIKKYGDKDPQLLSDLKVHRDALSNALNAKDIFRCAMNIVDVVKIIYENWLN